MSRESKFYVCVHSSCSFTTEKRKAIYSHLLRAHSERKEDYECEYCTDVFQREHEIEQHLHVHHPDQDFTYTCISRIENVLEQCAKLGHDQRRAKSQTTPHQIKHEPNPSPVNEHQHFQYDRVNIKAEQTVEYEDNVNDDMDYHYSVQNDAEIRTKASVNASLNNIAKVVQNNDTDIIKSEPIDYDEESEEFQNDADSSMFISKPSGLKIKLNLKRIAECSPSDSSRGESTSPPLLERHVMSRDASLDNSEMMAVSPPDIVHNKSVSSNVSIREKASKYFDKLEVYHTTDHNGMRCCPFCPYKTTKNTIRVHLSGIHKIYFVKCSLCDYRAAFPHQITQHGVKFHKTTNLNVIQLSKESRDKVIAKLPKSEEFMKEYIAREQQAKGNEQYATIENDTSNISYMDDVISSGSGSDDDSSMAEVVEEKTYKPPKCQTSKTDYYNIKVENGVYLYCCKLCPFQTPVRSTIYTHKYKHDEKMYRCAYCEFTSSPRSNVVHHCRTKHKFRTIAVYDVGQGITETVMGSEHTGGESENVHVKQEPTEENQGDYPSVHRFENANGTASSVVKNTSSMTSRSPATIIKVPQFKRSFPSSGYSSVLKGTSTVKKRRGLVPAQTEYKWSLNKMYRINPHGSPRYMCAQCPYACDTHPKMKHHLYRHRPQQYKCPYCDHRKYPRSYVVRHVRDTHRGKPLRVIDLGKDVNTAEPSDNTHDVNDDADDDDIEQDTEDGVDDSTLYQDPDDVTRDDDNSDIETSPTHIKTEPLDVPGEDGHDTSPIDPNTANLGCKSLADRLNYNLNKGSNDRMFSETPDVSPNFSETVYTSTPIIESIINNGQFPTTPKAPPSSSTPAKVHEKKKSSKDYRINTEGSPMYICNKCNFGTDNYKTIHNHMYRHELQRYQCPYCGYRRSPKSFVENHIREVHKGNPVIVTELTNDLETGVPMGSPRQCVGLKRKVPLNKSLSSLTPPYKTVKGGKSSLSPIKRAVKWPAPKPANKVNLSVPKRSQSSAHLQIPVKQKSAAGSGSASNKPYQMQASHNVDPGHYDDSLSDRHMSDGSTEDCIINDDLLYDTHGHDDIQGSDMREAPFREGSRTTFKTMYKCVFDPETCNHISKDKSKMKQHLFMHVEYRPWTCDLCEMTASQSSHIKNHVRGEHPNVSEMSFRYKKHNYLEKHIESFLTKGLFTVPVNEYRRIMDMKGTTKHSQKSTFSRDSEGFILCPFCTYKTKSGGMTDHVKMKHMHPRFKCHWCDYKAFYRSEVRKHHRKERSHAELEFKTQELDLSQMLNGSDAEMHADINSYYDDEESNIDSELSCYTDNMDDYGDQELSSQCSSPDVSAISVAPADMDTAVTDQNNVSDTVYTAQEIPNDNKTPVSNLDPVFVIKTEAKLNDGDVYEKVNDSRKLTEVKIKKGNKFKCGYCNFSASLRVKVKMHCSKRHGDKLVRVIEPTNTKTDTSAETGKDSVRVNVTQVNASDWKGTKFEQDLRNAGVSRLNLASLFPKSKSVNIKTEKYSDDEDETDLRANVEDKNPSVEYKESPNHLTIPFKKAPVRKKIDIPVTRTVKPHVEHDSNFKIPSVPHVDKVGSNKAIFPVSYTRASDELPEISQISLQKSESNSDHSRRTNDDSSELQLESDINDIQTDIIVEPLGDVNVESNDQYQTSLEKDSTEELSASQSATIDHSQLVDQGEEQCNENETHKDASEPSDTHIQTTFPNSTPVVLESEAMVENEEGVHDSEDYTIVVDTEIEQEEKIDNDSEHCIDSPDDHSNNGTTSKTGSSDLPAKDVPISDLLNSDVQSPVLPTSDQDHSDIKSTDLPSSDEECSDVPSLDLPTSDQQKCGVQTTELPLSNRESTDIQATDSPTLDGEGPDCQSTDLLTSRLECSDLQLSCVAEPESVCVDGKTNGEKDNLSKMQCK